MMSMSMCRSAELLQALLAVADEAADGDVARGDAGDIEGAPHPLRVLVEVGVGHGDGDAAVFAGFLDE